MGVGCECALAQQIRVASLVGAKPVSVIHRPAKKIASLYPASVDNSLIIYKGWGSNPALSANHERRARQALFK